MKNFDDIATAYSYKSTWDLKKANFIFSIVNSPVLYSIATKAVRLGFQIHLPIEPLIRKTVFEHFCGGETISNSTPVVDKLGAGHVETILDYSAEGEKTELGFDRTMNEILRTIENAANNSHFPFAVFKVTGIAPAYLLEKIQLRKKISNSEEKAFNKAKERIEKLCRAAYDHGVSILIDAEETWIQDIIDQVAYQMMERFNKEKPVVFNTYQLYRIESLGNLVDALQKATAKGYRLGVKLVRGAYMEKERERAKSLGYSSPIHSNVAETNKAFNDALRLCVDNIERVSVVCGSHNQDSTILLTQLMAKSGLDNNDHRIWFSQLYGMSDHISFNLAKAGYNVAKYLPYGPVKSVMPYLLRRAEENTSVGGQSNRELTMIRKELKRRKQLHSGIKDSPPYSGFL